MLRVVDNAKNSPEEKMITIQKCIKRQEILEQRIKKVNDRIKILRDDKKRFMDVYDANQAELTNILVNLNIEHTVIGNKELKISHHKNVNVYDETQVPRTYFKHHVVTSVDKMKIRRAYSQNPDISINGVNMVYSLTTRITTKN